MFVLSISVELCRCSTIPEMQSGPAKPSKSAMYRKVLLRSIDPPNARYMDFQMDGDFSGSSVFCCQNYTSKETLVNWHYNMSSNMKMLFLYIIMFALKPLIICTYSLFLIGVFQTHIVSQGPHRNWQFANLLQLNGSLVGSNDERVHPPICCLGEEVDEGLEEPHSQVLQVFWGLHPLGVRKEHVFLQVREK